MPFRVTVEPAALPLTLPEVREHLDIESGERDAYLETLISAAAKTVERWEWRALITQTIVLTLDKFPSGAIYLPRPRLQSPLTSIKYVDTAGVQQSLAAANYQLDATCEPGRVEPAYLCDWPDTRDDTLAAVEITYKAGYGATASSIPTHTKHLLKLLVSHFWNNPSAVTDVRANELAVGIDALLDPCHDGRVLKFV